MTIPQKIIDRFWTKVDKSQDCWLWTDSCTEDGYGTFHPSQARRLWWPHERAHRFSYIVTNGPIEPLVLMVCHSCDNPPCVNPDHLFLGDAQINTDDMISKGRHRNGREGSADCKWGHALSGDNLYINPTSNNRECVTCRKRRHLEYYRNQAKDTNDAPYSRTAK